MRWFKKQNVNEASSENFPVVDAPNEALTDTTSLKELKDELPEGSQPSTEVAVKPFPAVKKLQGIFSKKAAQQEKGKEGPRPIRVIIGYLPEVTGRDAMEYALGIAEKHFEQTGMAFFDAFKYAGGYAYEAHEGGAGKAYLPEIIKYFDESGPFNPGNNVAVVIKTATRSVEVQRLRDGLAAIILPESSTKEETSWLKGTESMQPALNKRTGFFVVGAALFTTGFIAMMVTSMLTRFQGYEPPPEKKVEFLNAAQLPSAQWGSLERVPSGSYVRALRYRNGKWESPELGTDSGPVAPDSPATAKPN